MTHYLLKRTAITLLTSLAAISAFCQDDPLYFTHDFEDKTIYPSSRTATEQTFDAPYGEWIYVNASSSTNSSYLRTGMGSRDLRMPKNIGSYVVLPLLDRGAKDLSFMEGRGDRSITVYTSEDGGKTWSSREPLQKDYLGPVKNKPLLNKGRLIAPTSIEKGGWRLYFEYSDDMGKTWERSDFVDADKGVSAIQPAIMILNDGRLAAVARTRSEHVGITYSADNGETWSKLKLIDTPNNNSGLDAVTLKDGRHVMICNDKPIPHGIKNGKGVRTPLSLLISDDGENWKHWITLEDSPISQYSYPSIIQTSDGNIHCIYTWRRQRIKHVEIKIN